MAARKQQDALCMICSEMPCTCPGLQKKASTPRKKLSSIPTQIVVPLPEKLEIQKQVKSGISALVTNEQKVRDDDELHERAALTALFKGGFILESIDDPKGFESVRPKLNMTQIDIDIQLWKNRRSVWLRQQ